MSGTVQRWIVPLLLLNIALTLAVLVRQEFIGAKAERSASLPETGVVSYARQVVDAYNNNDAERLYSLYHEEAQMKLTRDQVAAQLERLRSQFGVIERVSYINNIRLGEKGQEEYFQAHFSASLANPALDGAQLMLHLIREADGISLYGMRLNAAQP